ncbi:Diguanylate cyclase/phosphodiesterase [Mesobacillus zeae]
MAKTYCCMYENPTQLNLFIEKHRFNSQSVKLIQIYSGTGFDEEAMEVSDLLKQSFPESMLPEIVPAGEFLEISGSRSRIMLSFTTFHEKISGKQTELIKTFEKRIFQLAYYDGETGLPNRMKFTEMLEDMLGLARRMNQMMSVIIIDLDRFKMVNDSLGHFSGDEILKNLSRRIVEAIPQDAFLGRFGGDKFTLLLTNSVTHEKTLKVCEKILEAISQPVHYHGQELFLTASIGASVYPMDGGEEQLLLKNADMAVNRSKNRGGNRVTFYSAKMNAEAAERLELESYLRKALQKKEFYLCYQPLIDLDTSKVTGTEALIRWGHPYLGTVQPAKFIPLAEETGLILEMGEWVLNTACRQTKRWQQCGMECLGVSVNVSARQFQLPSFADKVRTALDASGLDPGFLTLELTESTMLQNLEYSIGIMQELRELGVKVSIDDFGTGYSS